MFDNLILSINDKLATATLYTIFNNEKLSDLQVMIALNLQTKLRKIFNIKFDEVTNDFYIEK